MLCFLQVHATTQRVDESILHKAKQYLANIFVIIFRKTIVEEQMFH